MPHAWLIPGPMHYSRLFLCNGVVGAEETANSRVPKGKGRQNSRGKEVPGESSGYFTPSFFLWIFMHPAAVTPRGLKSGQAGTG